VSLGPNQQKLVKIKQKPSDPLGGGAKAYKLWAGPAQAKWPKC